jgi:hypothetical protein
VWERSYEEQTTGGLPSHDLFPAAFTRDFSKIGKNLKEGQASFESVPAFGQSIPYYKRKLCPLRIAPEGGCYFLGC